MIRNMKTFTIGLIMLLSFVGVYFYMMSPSFGNGRNGLEYSDDMFNSLSKGSAYFIQEETQKAAKQEGKQINVNLAAKDNKEAQTWAKLYSAAGAEVQVNDNKVAVQGDLGKIMHTVLADSEEMYYNRGDAVTAKYGYEAREATYAWYNSFKAMDKEFKKQSLFKESSAIQSTMKKAIEPAYNYYQVEIKHVKDNKGTVTFMLLFYLIYTLWYGFSIYYLADGFGITMTKAAKKVEA